MYKRIGFTAALLAAALGEQRLLVASTDSLSAPTELRKGPDRLDAPALSADGGRVAFQMMPKDDWEINAKGMEGWDWARAIVP